MYMTIVEILSFPQRVYKHIKLAEKYYFHFALFIIVQDELSSSIKSKYIYSYSILL